jgi:hypothetical protein
MVSAVHAWPRAQCSLVLLAGRLRSTPSRRRRRSTVDRCHTLLPAGDGTPRAFSAAAMAAAVWQPEARSSSMSGVKAMAAFVAAAARGWVITPRVRWWVDAKAPGRLRRGQRLATLDRGQNFPRQAHRSAREPIDLRPSPEVGGVALDRLNQSFIVVPMPTRHATASSRRRGGVPRPPRRRRSRHRWRDRRPSRGLAG